MPVSDPSVTYLDDRHIYLWGDPEQIEIVMERFREQRNGDIQVEVKLTTGLKGYGKVAGPTKLNLMAPRSIKGLANECQSRVQELDWYDALSKATWDTIERIRSGDPLQLHTQADSLDRRWLLRPFLEDSGWTVLYAKKGAGKSYFALAMCLSIATGEPIFGAVPTRVGPVAYLDWEANKETFDVRLTKLSRPLGLSAADRAPIYYRHGESSLYASVPALQRGFHQYGVVACVVDSKSVAMSGAPQGEAVLEINRAIRRLGVPTILIDHMSKEAIKGDGPDMAIGSVHTGNAARLVWKMNSTADHDGMIRSHLRNSDANNGPRARDMELTLLFQGDDVLVTTGHVPSPRVPERLPADLPDAY